MNKLLSFAAFLMIITSCDAVEWDEPEIKSAFCLTERETVEVVKDISGIIVQSGDSYLIQSNTKDHAFVFAPCNLPADYQKSNLEVVFSGKVKEILPQEKWAGAPLELIKIKRGTSL